VTDSMDNDSDRLETIEKSWGGQRLRCSLCSLLHDPKAFQTTATNPRKQASTRKRYLSGRYGAVPIVSQGEFLSAVREDT
jgi:hypothetical protein